MPISTKDLNSPSCDELVKAVAGEVLFQENKKFEAARTAVWNLDRAGLPAVIVKCKNAKDVSACIKFAKSNNLRICAHTAGAHSSHAVVDDCLTIDLSLLRSVTVDAENRTATIAGGATIGDVDTACKPHGLALPMGHVHHTGVAGMALNATSGVGYLCRTRYLTASYLKSVTLVTSDGSIIEVNETENSDLLWGMRGAGSNFGIATEMVFSLTKVAPKVYCGDMIKFGKGTGPGAYLFFLNSKKTRAEIVKKYFDFFEDAPDECSALVVIAPKGPVVSRLCYIPSEADSDKPKAQIKKEAKAAFKPYASFGKTLINGTKMMDYWDGVQKLGQFEPSYYYQKGNVVDIPKEVIGTVVESLCDIADSCPVTNMGTGIIFMPLGGKLSALSDTSVCPTGEVFSKVTHWAIIIVEYPKGPKDLELRKQCQQWVRDVYRIIEPYGATDNGRARDYHAETYGEIYGSNVPRLAELKAKYDPDNIFSLNRNIAPK